MYSKYVNSQVLLNSSADEDIAENSVLWTLEYVLFMSRAKGISEKLRAEVVMYFIPSMVYYVKSCFTNKPGLANQFPEDVPISLEKDKYMSPDQLIAFSAVLFLFGSKRLVCLMWRWLISHWFTYDNVSKTTNFKRLMQPSAILFLGILAGNPGLTFLANNKITQPLMKWLLGGIACSASPDQTSGKLKAAVMWMTLGWDIAELEKRFDTRYFKSWKDVIQTYFANEDHPMHILAKFL